MSGQYHFTALACQQLFMQPARKQAHVTLQANISFTQKDIVQSPWCYFWFPIYVVHYVCLVKRNEACKDWVDHICCKVSLFHSLSLSYPSKPACIMCNI